MSPDERDILARAPLTLAFVTANTRRIAIARGLERAGMVKLEYVEGKAFGDPASMCVWITTAGAEAYARETAG